MSSTLYPTVVIENVTTGKILFKRETTFPNSKIVLTSALEKIKEAEDKISCYLVIGSIVNLNDYHFKKQYVNEQAEK